MAAAESLQFKMVQANKPAGLLMAVCMAAVGMTACTAASPGNDEAGKAAAASASRTCYEVFVYSFYDSDGDGIGDLRGVLEKLDYINDGDPDTGTDLGCDMIWLMPVFASPTYHKYDVTDYLQIDPVYGTLEDFRALIAACHERGVRVILDLPVNHTSSEHPWFAQAVSYLRSLQPGVKADASGDPYFDYYVFSQAPGSGYAQVADTDWYYEARFWEGMPDLNLDSEAVRREIRKITDYWTEQGADGYRLDAVTSYYTENRAACVDFCRWLCETVREKNPDAYLVGEAWTDLQTYAGFYESGIDSMFDFSFAGQEGVIARVASGKKPARWYGERLVEEEAVFASYVDEGFPVTNAPFYTNHDMARSAGYYARDDGSRTKFAMGLNLLMPGRAFLYYGEELGMKGSGKDENKRAPMQWSTDPNAAGMCAGPPDMDEIKMKFPPADEQTEDQASIFSYVRRAVRLRKKYPQIACGRTVLPESGSVYADEEICVFLREGDNGSMALVAVNNAQEEKHLKWPSAAAKKDSGAERADVILDGLYVGTEKARMEEGELIIPAFGIVILDAGDLTW